MVSHFRVSSGCANLSALYSNIFENIRSLSFVKKIEAQKEKILHTAKIVTKVSIAVFGSLTLYAGAAALGIFAATISPLTAPLTAALAGALIAGIWKDLGGPYALGKSIYEQLNGFECLKT